MNCLFCEVARGSRSSDAPEEHILAASENFIAKPGLGPLSEGYLLIIPREHSVSFSEMDIPSLKEASLLTQELASRLQKMYDLPISYFEHGCFSGGGRGGSCIDHAHLHLLPTTVNLGKTLGERFQSKRIQGLTELSGYCDRSKRPYIYYHAPTGLDTLYDVPNTLESQFLRRLISQQLGLEGNRWDWRLFPLREEIMTFNEKFLHFSHVHPAGPIGLVADT